MLTLSATTADQRLTEQLRIFPLLKPNWFNCASGFFGPEARTLYIHCVARDSDLIKPADHLLVLKDLNLEAAPAIIAAMQDKMPQCCTDQPNPVGEALMACLHLAHLGSGDDPHIIAEALAVTALQHQPNLFFLGGAVQDNGTAVTVTLHTSELDTTPAEKD